MTDLPPHIIEARASFIDRYADGGLEACEKLLNGLAVEREAASVLAGAARVILQETVAQKGDLTYEEKEFRLRSVQSVYHDKVTAGSRHGYAKAMFDAMQHTRAQ